MYKIFNYDENLFPFKKTIEKILNSDIELLHKKYNFDNNLCDFTGGSINNNVKINNSNINIYDFTQEFYSKLLNDDFFINIWKNFSFYLKKHLFNDEEIYIQKTPSIKIIPSNSNLQYVEKTSIIFNREINWHIDNQEPFWHPTFEKNMWMSVMDTDEDNALYVEDNDDIIPLLTKHNQLVMFDGIHHGAFVHNRSSNTRISLDFKIVPLKDYDSSLLSDKIVKKRGKYFKQSEWYTESYYYDRI